MYAIPSVGTKSKIKVKPGLVRLTRRNLILYSSSIPLKTYMLVSIPQYKSELKSIIMNNEVLEIKGYIYQT